MHARLQRQADLVVPGVLRFFGGTDVCVEQLDTVTIKAQVELGRRQVGVWVSTDPHEDRVFRVERKMTAEQDPATDAERQIVARFAGGAAAGGELLNRRAEFDRSDREPADAARRRHVLLHMKRRNRKHRADIVKAISGIVRGQA